MAKSCSDWSQGERWFLLYDYLTKNTGKGRVATRAQIFDHLAHHNITISPHTFYSDLAVLQSGIFKLEIEFDQHAAKGAGGYWVKNPPFEPYELRLVVDSIQASKFITQEQANKISRKITALADKSTRVSLNRQAYVSNRVRSMNESVVKDADRLHEAIAEDRKIAFRYFHYTPDKDTPKKYSKSGETYVVSPFALLWNDGNYYLYAYLSERKKFRTFRVDRMDRISVPLLEEREGKREYNQKNLTAQKAKVFGMFHGEEYNVRLRVSNRLADAVIDQFGKEIVMVPADSGHFTASPLVEISPPFFAWVATFGRGMKILGPEPVIEKMKDFLNRASEMYEDE